MKVVTDLQNGASVRKNQFVAFFNALSIHNCRHSDYHNR